MNLGTDSLDAPTSHHITGDNIWALELRNNERPIVKGIERHQFAGTGNVIQIGVPTTRNVLHSRAQFFNIKQEESETLDEYWKKLVDIERKC